MNNEVYAVMLTDNENFGIDSKITLHKTINNAKHKMLDTMVDLMGKVKINDKKYTEESFEFLDEKNNQYTGKITKIYVADKPHLEAGNYPLTMNELMTCFTQHNVATSVLNSAIVNETMFKQKEQIENLKEYIDAIERSKRYAENALEKIEKMNNIMWLSIDEAGNEFDYALFHNKDTAISYLSCRFEQALEKIGFRNRANTSAEDKAKYYTEKEKFAKNNKMKYQIEGTNFNCYGKVYCIGIDVKEKEK